jgi:hypothetical protein
MRIGQGRQDMRIGQGRQDRLACTLQCMILFAACMQKRLSLTWRIHQISACTHPRRESEQLFLL